jgi:hypothetical protein
MTFANVTTVTNAVSGQWMVECSDCNATPTFDNVTDANVYAERHKKPEACKGFDHKGYTLQ